MVDDGLADVRKRLQQMRRAESRLVDARSLLHAAIVDALRAGVRQSAIVQATGYTRERIRQIAIADAAE